MKYLIISAKDLMLIIALLQEFRSALEICEGAAMRLFIQFLAALAEQAVKAPIAVANCTNSRHRDTLEPYTTSFYHKNALAVYFDKVQFFLRRYVINDNIAKEVPTLRQGSMTRENMLKNCARRQ